MRYTVFTDGSCKTKINKASASYLIRTDKKYITSNVEAFTSMFILHAELYAIIDAIYYLIKDCKITEGDHITMHIDSQEAIDVCKNIIMGKKETGPKAVIYNKVGNALQDLTGTGAKMSLKKVHAHKEGMNSNKFVDQLAKLGIKHNNAVLR